MKVNVNVRKSDIRKAEQVLIDNGIEADEAKKKIWARLGGYVEVDKETEIGILGADKESLKKAIEESGFTLDGETYIPCLGDIEADIDFNFEKAEMVLMP